jgi:hypothetical protein
MKEKDESILISRVPSILTYGDDGIVSNDEGNDLDEMRFGVKRWGECGIEKEFEDISVWLVICISFGFFSSPFCDESISLIFVL